MLILGLLVVALAGYQVYEVPAMGRNDEVDHMNYVKDRFVDYKISVDSLWINSVCKEEIYDPVTGVTLSTSVNLGTEGGLISSGDQVIPFFNPLPSAGSLKVDGEHGHIYIYADGTEVMNSSLGILEYDSDNNYWVDQTYIYQMGGVFLRQNDGSIAVRVDPPLSIYKIVGGSEAAVQITPISLYGSQMVGGSGPVNINTRLRSTEQYLEGTKSATQVQVNIICEDEDEADVWRRVFVNAIQREGVSGWCDVSTAGNTATVLIYGPFGEGDTTSDIRLDIFRADYFVSLQNVATAIE